MTGEEEKAYELLKNELFKDKRFEEDFNKIVAKKQKEFFTEFNKLNIFEKYEYIVMEMFLAKVYRQLLFSGIKALREELKVTDEFQDILYKTINQDFEKNLDSDISTLKEYNTKKNEKKDEPE